MTHASLFSGFGGFDLAAEWMGWENVLHCENNPFAQRLLKYYWPEATSYGDIKQTDFTIHRGTVEVLTGGFPCQPYSMAGKRKGKEDDRHLWPEMLRAIREIQPRYVVGENVRGLTNWNGGMVFDEVQADLEAEGYEVLPFLLPACAVNAPHRRDRIWFIAHHNERSKRSSRKSDSIKGKRSENYDEQKHGREQTKQHLGSHDVLRNVTDTKSKRLERSNGIGMDSAKEFAESITSDTPSIRQSSEEHGQAKSGRTTEKSLRNDWQNFPTQSPVCSGDDGLSCRLVGVTFPKWRNESIKGFGNAIVPQVAFEIFKVIEAMSK